MTAPSAGGDRKLGEDLRISLLTFNTNIEVLYSFWDYDRSAQSRSRLNQEISRLAFSDSTTDFAGVFSEMTQEYSGSFREDAQKFLVIYSNGNQHEDPDYAQIKASLESMDITVLGMSFSPGSDGTDGTPGSPGERGRPGA